MCAPATCCTSSCPPTRCSTRRGDPPRLPSPRRLQAQAEEPAEVPGQVARLGRLPRRVRARARRSGERRRPRCRSIPSVRRRSGAAVARARVRWRSTRCRRGVATTVIGPGIVPKVEPRLKVHARTSSTGRAPTCAGRSSLAFDRHRHDAARRSDVGQMRLLGELARSSATATGPRDDGSESGVPLGPNENVEAFYKSLAAAGLARAGAGTLADVTSCPGAESCKLAVTQSRGLGRVLADHLRWSARISSPRCPDGHQDQRLPERLRPAPHRRHRLSGQPEKGRRSQPVPQYFVMVGGGVGEGMTTFGRWRRRFRRAVASTRSIAWSSSIRTSAASRNRR